MKNGRLSFKEIKNLYKSKNLLEGKFYIIKFLLNNNNSHRIVINVKRIKKAVKRNYEKRIIREFLKDIKKQNAELFFDFLVIVKGESGDFKEKKIEFTDLYKKICDYENK